MRNLTLLTDFYELTMMNGYLKEGIADNEACFDVFYRGGNKLEYAMCAGLEQVVDYVNNLHFDKEDLDYLDGLNVFGKEFIERLKNFKFTGDIYAVPEGTIIFPYEPILTIKAPLFEAQLLETAILCVLNHQTLIATKAARLCQNTDAKIMEFGLRRAQGPDAGIYGARAAYIGGCRSTSNVLAGQMFGIPVKGTHAHSWVMSFPDELTAFRAYAELYPEGCMLLVDTYDTLKSGVPNAIKVFDELKQKGYKPLGIRLDSGDLAYLSKKARKMLDEAGFPDARIVVSNSLDEYTITSILDQGGCINSFGVGERLITAKSDPVFGAVYKIAAVNRDGKFEPRIKISESVEKITNPGLKEVYRVYDEEGHAVADLLANYDEKISTDRPFRYVDPEQPWKNRSFENFTVKKLKQPVIKAGKRVMPTVSLTEVRDYVKRQLATEIWQEEQRFENPHRHYLDMTPDYYELKMSLLHNLKEI